VTRTHYHRAFGLTIRADRRIPALLAASSSGDADVRVELPRRPPPPLSSPSLRYESPLDRNRQRLRVWRSREEADLELAYSDGTRLRVDAEGTRIVAWWPDPLTLADVSAYLLGPVMGLVLRLRGRVCLHASAVEVEGGAVGILAPAGHGKSTTAAAFALRGHPVLTDDLLVLEERGEEFVAPPAYPRLRLWPAAVEALLGSADALPRISPGHPDWDKRYLDLTADDLAFVDRPLPLRALYTGVRDDRADGPRLQTVHGAEALLVSLANRYAARLADRGMRARDFDMLARLVERVPVVRFGIREGIDRLDGLRRAIVADCRDRRARDGGGGPRADRTPAEPVPRSGP